MQKQLISLDVLPTPEKTILFGSIPALIAFKSSPPDTTSAPEPNFARVLSIVKLVLALAAKHIRGLIFLKLFEKFK